MNPIVPSNTTQRLIEMLIERDAAGQAKYGQTLDRADLLAEDWAQHAIEESLDRAGYLVRVAQTAAELRAENVRLAEENLRLRSMILPFVEFAKTLDLTSSVPAKLPETVGMLPETVGITAPPVEVPAPLPSASSPMPTVVAAPAAAPPAPTPATPVGLTAQEIAAALGCHKDSIHNYKKAGLLPEPVPGTGGHPHNPSRYDVDIEKLRKRVQARQEAAKSFNKGKLTCATPPKPVTIEPTFDVDENGRYEAIEHGRSFFRPEKKFTLVRVVEPTRYKWLAVAAGAPVLYENAEAVEHWNLNGLGQWESANVVPGMAGTGNGASKGAAGYTVRVPG